VRTQTIAIAGLTARRRAPVAASTAARAWRPSGYQVWPGVYDALSCPPPEELPVSRAQGDCDWSMRLKGARNPESTWLPVILIRGYRNPRYPDAPTIHVNLVTAGEKTQRHPAIAAALWRGHCSPQPEEGRRLPQDRRQGDVAMAAATPGAISGCNTGLAVRPTAIMAIQPRYLHRFSRTP
jgi:hypothetical protein